MIVGLPGIVLAVILPKIIRDPRGTGEASPGVAAPVETPALSFGEAAREIFGSKAWLYIFIAASFTAFLSYGKGIWTISFFIRSHGLSTTEAGLTMAVALGLSGIIGTWLGGVVADRFGKHDKRHLLTMPALGMTIAAPLLFFAYWSENWVVGVALLVVPTILNAAYYGPAYGCVQGLARRETRAVAASLVVFGQNLIGLGLGPLFFGMLSDALEPFAGIESVRWVLYGAAWLGLIPAFFFWRASLRLNDELKSG
jgi:MFS family permease